MLKDYFKGKNINVDVSKYYFKLDPDEAIAIGATVAAEISTNNKFRMENEGAFIDITPLSLGIETEGGLMSKVINFF